MPFFDESLTPGGWFDEESDSGGWFSDEVPPPSSGAGFSGDVEITITQGSFTVEPFLWPHLANKVLADIVSNVSTLKVYGEGTDGSRVLINNNQPGITKPKTAGQSTEYAGSWAQDFGAGVVTDTGNDHAPTTGGISSGVMGSAHLSTAFQMLADRTYESIILVCTPTDPDQPIEVNFGLEYDLSASRKVVHENAHQNAIIHPSGPGVRTGFFNTGTSGTLTNPPTVYDPTERSNLVDGLITGRLLVEGIAHDDGLTTELTTLYDTTEGQSVGQARNNSHWFWLPVTSADWIMAVVNSMSEIPPLCEYPLRERNATTWEDDGDFVQHVYIAAQEPDYFVNPSQAVELRADDDTTVWTSPGSGVAGWSVSEHSHAVDNDETDFGIWLADRFGELRPFRGHYSVVPPIEGVGGLSYCVAPDLKHYVAFTNATGQVVTIALDNALNETEEVQVFDGERVHLAAHKDGTARIRLCYEDGGSLYHRISYDGLVWGSASAGVTGEFMISVPLDDRGYFLYYLDGTDIKGEEYDAADNMIGSAFTAVAGVDADSVFDAFESSPGQSGWRICLWCLIGTVRTLKISVDGRVFA